MRRTSSAFASLPASRGSKRSTFLTRNAKASGALLLSCLLLCSAASFAAAPDRIAGPAVAGQMVEVPRSLHPLARAQNDAGALDPQFRFTDVALQTTPSPSQQQEMETLLAEQQDPASPNYHRWLTPEQYGEQFGLSANDVGKITAWLEAQGLTVVRVEAGRNSIIVSGTAAQFAQAFQTEFRNYKVNGASHFANATPLKIPAAWADVVGGIRGLNSFHLKAMRAQNQRPMHRDYYDSTLQSTFVAPGDVATIYDLNALYGASPVIDGTGQKLAIIGQTDVYLADINDFRSGFGLSQIPTSGSNSCTVNGSGLLLSCSNATNFGYVLATSDPGTASACGDLSEADLDLEWSGATARNAQIIYVNAPALWNSQCNSISGGGVELALSYAIQHNTAPVISLSYGACEAQASNDEIELQQAAMQGQTILNSSGDTAAAGCDGFTSSDNNLALYGLAVSYPASSQYVTGVGGSAVPYSDLPPFSSTYWNLSNGSDGGSAKGYVPEEAWNDPFAFGTYCELHPTDSFCTSYGISSPLTAQEALGLGGGGGGASNCFTETQAGVCQAGFPQPSYQTSLSVPGAPAGVRYVPDVSLMASPNFPGYIFCTERSEWLGSGSGSTCSPGGSAGIVNTLALMSGGQPAPTIVGGTSVSTPIFAGMVALLNQYLGNTNGMGNINPTLYTLATTPSNHAFHQLTSSVTTGNNQVYCEVGQPSNQPTALQCPSTGILGYLSSNADATTGYNLVTGLGSVDASNLAVAWAASLSTFTLAASPSTLSIAQGGSAGTSTITVTDVGGFTGSVSLAASGLPTGVTAVFNPTATTTTSTLTLTASGSATVGGPTTVTITGTSGSLTSTTTIALTVTGPPTFTLSDSPTSLSLTPLAAGGTSTITVHDQNGFSGSVGLAASGLPTGVTAAFNPTSTTTTSTLTLTAGGSAVAGGPTTVTITGTSGALSATTTVAVTVNPTLNFSGQPTTPAPALSGETTTSGFTVTPTNGATTSVITFSCNGLPNATTCTFDPTSIPVGTTTATDVTVYITTSGPNTVSLKPQKRRAENRSPWLPFSLPLAGVVFASMAARKKWKHSVVAGLGVLLALTVLLVSCGGGGNSAPAISVSVSPTGATTFASAPVGSAWPPQTATFTATVANSTNTAVTWSVATANGGSITPGGVYTAPVAAAGVPASAIVTATSQADTTKSGSATVTISPTTVPGNYSVSVIATEGPTVVQSSTTTLAVQ